jgi:hypothetical protein
MRRRREENPFIFGEIGTGAAFVDRVDELQQVVRDVTDGRKLFLLSPRRFGKSSLVVVAFERLNAEGGLSLPQTALSIPSATASWCLFGVCFYRGRGRFKRMDRPNRNVLAASVDRDFEALR